MAIDPEILHAHVDAEDVDGLLELVSVGEIAAAWCRYSGREHRDDDEDPDWWAIALFFTREIFRRPALYRSLLVKLVDVASDDVLGNVAAGPLENFVSDDEDDLRWLESECARNPRLRTALAGVWCARNVSEQTMRRLDAAAGEPLARPSPRETWRPEVIAVEDAHTRLMDVVGPDWGDIDRIFTPEEQEAIAAYLTALERMFDMLHDDSDEASY